MPRPALELVVTGWLREAARADRELQRRLRRAANAHALESTRIAAKVIRRQLRATAPVRTGALKRSVKVRFRRAGTSPEGFAIYAVNPETLWYGRFAHNGRWIADAMEAGAHAAGLRIAEGDR